MLVVSLEPKTSQRRVFGGMLNNINILDIIHDPFSSAVSKPFLAFKLPSTRLPLEPNWRHTHWFNRSSREATQEAITKAIRMAATIGFDQE